MAHSKIGSAVFFVCMFLVCASYSWAAETRWDATADFSGQPGVWSYLSGQGNQLTPMHWAGTQWQGPETYALLYATGAHPGGRVDAVRQWTSPLAGVVRVSGQVADMSTTCGEGVRTQILREDLLLWQYDLVNGGPAQDFDLLVPVEIATQLRFVTNKGTGNNWCDWTNFAPVIAVITDLAQPTLLPLPGSQIEAFGYYAVRYPELSLIAETSAWTNTMLFYPQWGDKDLPIWQALRAAGMKAIISIPYLFEVDPVRISPSGTAYRLREAWLATWTDFQAHSGVREHLDLVRAFYLIDEAFWNGVRCEELGKVANQLKASFPTVPVLLIEASGEGIRRLCPIQAIDWVGFDYYGVLDPRTDTNYQGNLKALQAKLLAHQKFVYVLDAFYGPGHQRMHLTPEDLGPIAEHYWQMAQADPRAIGILGFTWNPDSGGTETILGAKNLPADVLAIHQWIGRSIKHQQ